MNSNNSRVRVCATQVSRHDIVGLPSPDSMGPRHYPIRHDLLLDIVDETLKRRDLHVKEQNFYVSHKGKCMYSSYILNGGTERDGFSMAMAVVGAQDQSSSARMLFGTNIFICSNGMFTGEITLSRKNTRFAPRDLPKLTDRGVNRFVHHYEKDAAYLEAWKEMPVSREQEKALLFDVLVSGLLPRAHIFNTVYPRVLSPEFAEHRAGTVYALQNAFTESHKERLDRNPFKASQELMELDGMMKSRFRVEQAEAIEIPDEFLPELVSVGVEDQSSNALL